MPLYLKHGRSRNAFTTVEALVAVALVGLLMGGLMLSSSNVVTNLVQGVTAEKAAHGSRVVTNALYRMMETSEHIFVTPTLNHAAGCDWDWGPLSGSPVVSRSAISMTNVVDAQQHLASFGNTGSTTASTRDNDPTVPFYDLAAATGRSLSGNGYMVWFVRSDASVLGVLTIEKTASATLTVSLFLMQGSGTLEGTSLSAAPGLLESYSVDYAPATNATYRQLSQNGFPVAPADYYLLQSVRQFGTTYYGASSPGHYNGALILLPNPYDLDAVSTATKFSPQALAIEHASPVFVYEHSL